MLQGSCAVGAGAVMESWWVWERKQGHGQQYVQLFLPAVARYVFPCYLWEERWSLETLSVLHSLPYKGSHSPGGVACPAK